MTLGNRTVMITEADTLDYRELLRKSFEERHSRNPSYSMRAFARDLELTSPRLSDIFQGRQGLSRSVALKIVERLGYDEHKAEVFCYAVESRHGRSRASREAALAKLQKFTLPPKKVIGEDQFKIIADWYHFSILSLTNVRGFQSNFVWIAQRLGLEVAVVEQAIERLLRVGLLKTFRGKWVETGNFIFGGFDVPAECGRSYQRQILEKAQRALNEQSVHDREITSMTLAIDPSKIPMAKKMIADFMRDFDRAMAINADLQKLYGFGIQFFSLERQESQDVS